VGLLAVCAYAQTPALVHILSDDSQVLVGRSLQMRAVVRDSAGDPIPNAAVTWAIHQPQAGSISTNGLVTARGLATIRVTARSGSVTGEAAIQSIPSRMEVTPSSAALEIGSRMQFRATAYDADGAPIPGVPFSWSLTNQRQGSSSLGRIDNTGMVTATGEGGAWVWATYNYNETFPACSGNGPCIPPWTSRRRRLTSSASSIRHFTRRARVGLCVRANPCSGAATTASCSSTPRWAVWPMRS